MWNPCTTSSCQQGGYLVEGEEEGSRLKLVCMSLLWPVNV